MNVLTGPVATVSRVTQKNKAEADLQVSSFLLVQAAGILGDIDSDGVIEPPASRASAGLPAPTNGGLLPNSLGLTLSDPWGTEYGFCSWDHGAANTSTGRINGDNTGGQAAQFVLAVISAGPNKVFETACSAFAGAAVTASKAAGSDDLIRLHSYSEATSLGGGLWTLNASDANTAELKSGAGVASITADRSGGIINAAGVITTTISAPASANDTLRLGGGLLLDNPNGTATECGAGETGALRLAASLSQLEICSGTGWIVYGTLADGDKGDITVSSTGTAWAIDAQAVTFAKLQNISTARLLGRTTAGSGSVEQISIGSGLTLSGGTLSASETDPQVGILSPSKWCAANAGGTGIDCTEDAPAGGAGLTDGDKGHITVSSSGSVWSIDNSTITSQMIVNGAIVSADIANGNVTFAKIQNVSSGVLLGRSSAGVGDIEALTIGAGLSLSGGILSASGGSESDPEVDTLMPSKWCIANAGGTAIDCTQDAPAGGGGGSLSDGDKGDITVSSAGSYWGLNADSVGSVQIEDTAVTFAKIQEIQTARLVGRYSAGEGPMQTITIGSGLTLTSGTLSANAPTETDPQVGSLTSSKWCAANAGGTAIDCTQNAPSGGGNAFGGVLLGKNTNQAISNNSVTSVTWDSETYDTDALHDTSANTDRITIPAALNGRRIVVGCQVEFATNNTGIREVQIVKNGTAFNAHAFAGMPANNGYSYSVLSASAPDTGSTNSYYQCRVKQTSGGNLNVTGVPSASIFYVYTVN